MSYFTGDVGLPWIIGLLVILLETIGSLALVVGLGTRLVAAAFTMLAFGILMTVHLQNGFFMNWSNNQNGEGYEYFLLWLAISIALIISGAGRLSVDRKIAA
jgi:putative oxidoreductase